MAVGAGAGKSARSRIGRTVLRVTYIGHATLLIEIGGKRLLTDPNFDPALGRFLPRVSAPGIALDALPKLDAILLTHAHADHLSFDSLDALPRRHPGVCASRYRQMAAETGLLVMRSRSHQVKWSRWMTSGFVPLQPSIKGSRYGIDRWRSAANMYLIETNKISAFFAGDTALTPDTTHLVDNHLATSGRSLDLALLPIGHAPWWKPGFRKGHLTSADALTLFERLKARYFIPYHWGTFNHVTSTAFDAIDRLRATLAEPSAASGGKNSRARRYFRVADTRHVTTAARECGPARGYNRCCSNTKRPRRAGIGETKWCRRLCDRGKASPGSALTTASSRTCATFAMAKSCSTRPW